MNDRKKENPIINFLNKNNDFKIGTWLFLGLLYRLVLDFSYVFATVPIYSYAGLEYNPSAIKYIVSVFLYSTMFLLLPKEERIGSIFLNVQFVIAIAPLLTFYAFNNQNTSYIILIYLCVLVQIYILRKNSTKKIIQIKNIKPYTTIILMLILFLTVIIPIIYNGFAGLKAFDFYYLYEMREIQELPIGFGYLISWTTNIIIPFMIIYSLNSKKYVMTIFLSLITLVIYMTLGYKYIYLCLFVILGTYFANKLKKAVKLTYISISMMLLFFTIAFMMDQGKTFASVPINLITVRFLFGPAAIKFQYYEFFSVYPKIFFSDGQIGHAFSLNYPYADVMGRVIFSVFFEKPLGTSNSSTGYLGEAYAQMGYLGVVCMSILVAYIFKFIESYSIRLQDVILPCVALYIVILNEGALFSTLLGGGMWLLIFLVFVYGSEKENKEGIVNNDNL